MPSGSTAHEQRHRPTVPPASGRIRSPPRSSPRRARQGRFSPAEGLMLAVGAVAAFQNRPPHRASMPGCAGIVTIAAGAAIAPPSTIPIASLAARRSVQHSFYDVPGDGGAGFNASIGRHRNLSIVRPIYHGFVEPYSAAAPILATCFNAVLWSHDPPGEVCVRLTL
jgi:hypothetical protein